MKAMILAAGLGTRLKPWTLCHPKALVPVGGIPMLERVITKLISHGFDNLTVNIHHFGEQIVEFLAEKHFDATINISDERGMLLDTGGGIVHAARFLCSDSEPFLVHNVDILSDANLNQLVRSHQSTGADATLLVSDRNSSRRLISGNNSRLVGWHNVSTGEFRPSDYNQDKSHTEYAFSGIHCVSPKAVECMIKGFGYSPFPIMDFYLSECGTLDFRCHRQDFSLIDIGKPETLKKAESLFR